MKNDIRERAKNYNKLLAKELLKIGVEKSETDKIKKFLTKKEAIQYIRKNLQNFIPDLQVLKIKPFVDELQKEKNTFTRIIYTPMGNKR